MKFVVIGSKAVRDGTVAEMKEHARLAGLDAGLIFADTAPVVEFETTARINDFFRVKTLTVTDGQVTVARQFFARTSDEIFAQAGDTAALSYEKITVFPYLEPAERGARKVRAVATAHG